MKKTKEKEEKCEYYESDWNNDGFRYCELKKGHLGLHYMGKLIRVDW